LRTCKLNLTKANIEKEKFKVCLEYHLGNCKGPCEGFQSVEDYNEGLQQIKQMLKGNLGPVIQRYKEEMDYFSRQMQFEKAAIVKSKLDYLEGYQSKSVIVTPSFGEMDVFSILREKDVAYVNYLMLQHGTIVQTHTITLQPQLEESDEEILSFAVVHLRKTFNSVAREIVVPFLVDYPDAEVQITIPKAGEKKKLLELSRTNVNYFIDEMKRKKMLHLEDKSEKEKMEVLEQLQKDLHLKTLPVQIECFDNSNFQGSFPVAAMVYFKNGFPDKTEYRRFNIKTVEGINDFASMKEIVTRRYKRLLKEDSPLPQLIIIDGGKGQLNAAIEGLEEIGMMGKVSIVGLAKNEEEIFYPYDQESLKLPWNSESLKLIRRIRDEVHRFGITFHRNQRSRGTFVNELEQIKGIGKNTADGLLKKFKSVKKVKELTLEVLEKSVGASRAALVYTHFHKEEA
jgi:excinuclease ABC subunit C